ncbi:3-octaprenyl-4-hydroxybenzoate carboxy-lyase [Phycisphaerae bacterium RAS2]|nr:3-octaprenyl-4-hydroxybenzoate carboxy-lyase [Phycisphaerae bacterium RAS2]
MAYSNLQEFIAALESAGQLRRVRAEVDPELEISAIADRVSKSTCPEGLAGAPRTDPVHGGDGGVGLLFERVRGSAMPVAINLFGSYARMRMALGCEDFESLAARVQKLAKPEPPATLVEKIKMLPELAKIAGYAPKRVKRGICQEVVHTDDVDLLALPIIKCWPHDGGADEDVIAGKLPKRQNAELQKLNVETSKSQNVQTHENQSRLVSSRSPGAASSGASSDFPVGRYITFAGIYTTKPDGSEPNIGMYRIQVTGPRSAIFHCHMHHDGARHQRLWAAQGRDMPVAIVLGGESVLPYAATCPLPPGISELMFAGFLNDGGIPMVPAKTLPLDVPANAEIVIEGFVSATESAREGPFGDHTGFYSLADSFPTIRVTAITHRERPIYPTTIVGYPPMEDYYMGKATERVFLPLLQMLIPDVVDYNLPRWGAFHNFCFVRIRKEYPLQARKVASSIWGAGQMMFSKFIVIVDEDVDVHDEQAVMFAVGAHVDPRRDTFIVDGPMDILDHAAPYLGAGSKMGIDATRKIPGEGVVRDWPRTMAMPDEVIRLVEGRWGEYGLP